MGIPGFEDVVIVSAYNTRQGRALPDDTTLSLIVDAIRGALSASGGLASTEIDGVNVAAAHAGFASRDAVHLLGGRPSWTGDAYIGIAGVLEAASAIAAGHCSCVVIASAQAGAYREHSSVAPWTQPDNEFVACWGLYTVAEFALVARRHMHLYGSRPEDFAEVASAIRANGARHPEAVGFGRFASVEDVLASRMIADPFHLLDCSITSEGGCAVLLTTRERARDLDARPISILAGGLDRRGASYKVPPVWDRYGDVGSGAARRAFSQAGLRPADVDFCEFYDPFSFEVIRQLEAFGFCGPGEGGAFAADGRLRLEGALPICTDGGLLSFSHSASAQLLQKVASAVHQLQGACPEALRLADPRVALVSNGGAGALFSDVLLLADGR